MSIPRVPDRPVPEASDGSETRKFISIAAVLSGFYRLFRAAQYETDIIFSPIHSKH